MIPLSIQQSQSAEYMKALKPYMNEIKEKVLSREFKITLPVAKPKIYVEKDEEKRGKHCGKRK